MKLNDLFDINIRDLVSDTSQIRVFIGVHNLKSDINSNTTFNVSDFKIHENYNTQSFENDIAIMRLSRSVVLSDTVNFICVEKNIITNEGDTFIVVGWGNMIVNNNKVLSDVLMQVNVPNLSTQKCSYSFDPSKQICAGDPLKVLDSCELYKLSLLIWT